MSDLAHVVRLFRAFAEVWAFRMSDACPSLDTLVAAGLCPAGTVLSYVECASKARTLWRPFDPSPHGSIYSDGRGAALYIKATRNSKESSKKSSAGPTSGKTARDSGSSGTQPSRF